MKILTKKLKTVNDLYKNQFTLIEGDAEREVKKFPDNFFNLIITSPPYNLKKEYEKGPTLSLEEYLNWLEKIIESIIPKLTVNGSLCWQVGNYVKSGEIYPLDIFFYEIFKRKGLKLRNRIIWRFNFGLHSTKRFSGRYETLLWFTKTDDYKFNLDPIRVPQLYPGKRHSKNKGEKAGKPSGNILGKNPADFWEFSPEEIFKVNTVWEIPNVKANHPEKTIHPCQFPIELVERCVLAFTDKGDQILDPFVGTGTSVIAALKHDRCAFGIDKSKKYISLANERLNKFLDGNLKMRPSGKPIRKPVPNEKVAKIPKQWKSLV